MDVQQMALIEIGACTVRMNIERVSKVRAGSVGSIVERVTIGVGEADGQRPGRLTKSSLKGVVFRVGDIFDRDNIAKAKIGANRICAETDPLSRSSASQGESRITSTRYEHIDVARIVRANHGRTGNG